MATLIRFSALQEVKEEEQEEQEKEKRKKRKVTLSRTSDNAEDYLFKFE